MKLKIKTLRNDRAGFTLAEVLAAMAFMAIVIPVAVRGLQIANRAGVLAQRKAIAARVGERVINEIVVARQWSQGTQSGTEKWRARMTNSAGHCTIRPGTKSPPTRLPRAY